MNKLPPSSWSSDSTYWWYIATARQLNSLLIGIEEQKNLMTPVYLFQSLYPSLYLELPLIAPRSRIRITTKDIVNGNILLYNYLDIVNILNIII